MKLVWVMVWLIIVVGCSKTEAPPQTPVEEEYPEQEMFTAKISFYTEDRLATLIEAGHVLQYEKQNLIILDSGIVADFLMKRDASARGFGRTRGRLRRVRGI